MPKSAKPSVTQRAKFIEAAKAAGCDDDVDKLAEIVKKIAKVPPAQKGRLKRAKSKQQRKGT